MQVDVGALQRMSAGGNDSALLIVAHGSTRYAEAARPAAAHVARLKAADPGRRVALGLLAGAPPVAEALAALDAARIAVVPFFMEDGYFTRVAIPRALGGDPRVRLCRPVGLNQRMAALITCHARLGCAERGLDPAATTVVLVGHGSARAPGQAAALRRHTATVAASGAFACVCEAHLEEPPRLPETLAALRGSAVAVVGFFAGEGGHVRDDVPAALAAEQAARRNAYPPVHNFGSVADNPAVTQIILEQAATA